MHHWDLHIGSRKSNSHSFNYSSFLRQSRFQKSSLVSGALYRAWPSNFPNVVRLFPAVNGASLLNCHSSVEIMSKLEAGTKVVRTAPSMLAKRIKERTEAGNGNIQEMQYRQPVQWKMTVACNHSFGDSTSRQQTFKCLLGEALLPPLPSLLLASPSSLRGLLLLLAHDAASIGPYTAAPRKLVQTPDHWVNAMITGF